MSTISSNTAFTALQIKVAAAKADQQSRVAPAQITTTSGTTSDNVLQKPNKLFEGLNQQAVLHFQVGQALRAKAAVGHSKEPHLANAKTLVAPVFTKKEEKPSFNSPSSDKAKTDLGLFSGLVFTPIENVSDKEEKNAAA